MPQRIVFLGVMLRVTVNAKARDPARRFLREPPWTQREADRKEPLHVLSLQRSAPRELQLRFAQDRPPAMASPHPMIQWT